MTIIAPSCRVTQIMAMRKIVLSRNSNAIRTRTNSQTLNLSFSTSTSSSTSANKTSRIEKNTPMSTGGVAFFGSLCVATFGLGCWQTQRYFEKIDKMKTREEELSMEPQHLLHVCSSHPDSSQMQSFRRIALRGTFRHKDEILIGPRGPPPGAISETGPNSGRSGGGMSSSPQGFYVLTPLELEHGNNSNNTTNVVLVNRGWVPRQYVAQNADWDRPLSTVNVVGVQSKPEQPKFMMTPLNSKEPKQLLWFDQKCMEEKTNTEGQSPHLLIETSINEEAKKEKSTTHVSFPVKPNAQTVGEFKVTPSVHAGYAVTWFGLSGAGILMTKKLITRGR